MAQNIYSQIQAIDSSIAHHLDEMELVRQRKYDALELDNITEEQRLFYIKTYLGRIRALEEYKNELVSCS